MRERDLDRETAALFTDVAPPRLPILNEEDRAVIRSKIPLTDKKRRPIDVLDLEEEDV